MGLQVASSWTRTEHALLVVELESERRACHMRSNCSTAASTCTLLLQLSFVHALDASIVRDAADPNRAIVSPIAMLANEQACSLMTKVCRLLVVLGSWIRDRGKCNEMGASGWMEQEQPCPYSTQSIIDHSFLMHTRRGTSKASGFSVTSWNVAPTESLRRGRAAPRSYARGSGRAPHWLCVNIGKCS